MKKTLALILSILALLIPVSALELDVAESAEVSVADEAVLAALPETTDANYGDLIYFSDFDENTNWVNTAVVGENATASFQLAYVQTGNWGSNKVADPNGENGNVQEIIVADHQYNWASGMNVSVKNATFENAVITMVYDVYFPNPVEEYFKAQLNSGWEVVSSADYDAEKGGWQTIVMNILASANISNGQYGFNFICNDTDKTSGTSGATVGLTYYVDNVRVYAREASYASKPASVDSSLGNLIYFDNGNSADAVNSDKIGLYGVSNLAVMNGYYAKKLVRDEAGAAMLSPGVVVKSTSGTFAANGFNGVVTLVADMMTSSSLSYYKIADVSSFGWGWGSWYAGSGVSTNVAYEAKSVSIDTSKGASGFGFMRSANNGAPYARSLAVYYMPATRVTVNGAIVDLYGMTEYTLPAFATSEYDSYKDANGNVYDAGKAYAVADIKDKVLTPYLKPKYAAKPAATTEDGELVFFYNGNTADTVNTLGADIIGDYGMGVYDGYHVTYTVDCTALIGSCSSHGIAIAPLADAYTKSGTITLYIEQYNNMGKDVSYTALSSVNLGVYKSAWGGKYADYDNTVATKSGNWYTLKATAVTENKFLGFFERSWVNHANLTRGFKSIAVYFQPYTATIGGEVVVVGNSTEYTLPTGEDFNYYKDEKGNYYEAGKAYAASVLNGKTLVTKNISYDEKPADISLSHGILVYFENGNAADLYSNMNATLVGYKNTTDADGYFTRDLGNPGAAGVSGTAVVGLDTGDLDTKFAYADGTDMQGVIYFYVDMYNSTANDNVFRKGVRTWSWDDWCGVQTNWSGIGTAKAGEWTRIGDAFNTELSFVGVLDTDNGGWGGITFKRAYAYYMPAVKITLNDAVNPQIIDLNNKTEYTFPAIADGNTVWAGQDGSYYFPGDVALVEDINGVTFDTANFNEYAPETDSAVEMRLTSNTAKNGIRFKAAIAPSKKAEADEIGFIIARKDILEYFDAELTFDLTAAGVDNAEGKLYVKGVAYDKATGKDVVAGTTDEGMEQFTVVGVGLDITNNFQVTTKLVARPYVKMTVNDNEITVYGATNSASLYDLASDLVAAAEEDEDARIAYEGAKEYVDTVIATAEAE